MIIDLINLLYYPYCLVLLLMIKMYIEIKGNSFDNRIMFIYIIHSIKLFFIIMTWYCSMSWW